MIIFRMYGFRITFPLPSALQGILGDLLASLTQSCTHAPAAFHETRRNEWRQQRNESTTFWERSGRNANPDPDQSGNPDHHRKLIDHF